MQNTSTFQLATHYLSKIALRLEYLFQTITESVANDHPLMHHCAIKNLLEIIQMIEKPELKSRFLKELIRIEHSLLKTHTTISAETGATLHDRIQRLSHVVGFFGEEIHSNPFLQSIRPLPLQQVPDYELNPPQLTEWLESSAELRKLDLQLWLTKLNTLIATVDIYLKILRERANFNAVEKFNGIYQRILPPKTMCHLIMLTIERSFGIIPRLKIGHYDLVLRLYDARTLREIKETPAKISLALCQI